jgi:hypothetical protein
MLRRAAERAAEEESARIVRGADPVSADKAEPTGAAIATDQPAEVEPAPEEKIALPPKTGSRKTKSATAKPAAAIAAAADSETTPASSKAASGSAGMGGSAAKADVPPQTNPAKTVETASPAVKALLAVCSPAPGMPKAGRSNCKPRSPAWKQPPTTRRNLKPKSGATRRCGCCT